jgi:hypothetical protein
MLKVSGYNSRSSVPNIRIFGYLQDCYDYRYSRQDFEEEMELDFINWVNDLAESAMDQVQILDIEPTTLG